MWELYTGEKLFDENISIGQVFYMIAYEGWRPQVPTGCPAGYVRLMTSCWARDPEQRPSACEVLDYLNQLYAAEKQQLQQGRQDQDLAQLQSLQQQQQQQQQETIGATGGAAAADAAAISVAAAAALEEQCLKSQQQQQGSPFAGGGQEGGVISEATTGGGGANTATSGWVNSSTEGGDSSVMNSWETEQAAKGGGAGDGMDGVGTWSAATAGPQGAVRAKDAAGGAVEMVQRDEGVTRAEAASEDAPGGLGADAAELAVARRQAAEATAHARAVLATPRGQDGVNLGGPSRVAAQSRLLVRDQSTSSTVSTGTLPRTMASGSAGVPLAQLQSVSTGSLPPAVASLGGSNRYSSSTTSAGGGLGYGKGATGMYSTSGYSTSDDTMRMSDQAGRWASSTGDKDGSAALGSLPEERPQPGGSPATFTSPFAVPSPFAGAASGASNPVVAGLRGAQQGSGSEAAGGGNATAAAEGGTTGNTLSALSPFAALADRAGSLFAPR